MIDTVERDLGMVALMGISLAASCTYTFGYGIPSEHLQFPLLHIYEMYPFHTSPFPSVWKMMAVVFAYMCVAFSLCFLVSNSTHKAVYSLNGPARKHLLYAMMACFMSVIFLQVSLSLFVKWYPSSQIETWKNHQLYQNTTEAEEEIPSFLEPERILSGINWIWPLSGTDSNDDDAIEIEQEQLESFPRMRYVVSAAVQLTILSFSVLYTQIHKMLDSAEYVAQKSQDEAESLQHNVLSRTSRKVLRFVFTWSCSYMMAFTSVFGWSLSMSMMQFGQYIIAITLFLQAYRFYLQCFVRYHDEIWAICFIGMLVMVVLKNPCLSFPALAISAVCAVDHCIRTCLMSSVHA